MKALFLLKCFCCENWIDPCNSVCWFPLYSICIRFCLLDSLLIEYDISLYYYVSVYYSCLFCIYYRYWFYIYYSYLSLVYYSYLLLVIFGSNLIINTLWSPLNSIVLFNSNMRLFGIMPIYIFYSNFYLLSIWPV